jgi:hypothetical protein
VVADIEQTPNRQVRASFDDATLVVYQAYSAAIADAAVSAGTFVAPFKLERMTWIKPSFLWMMYRSGWATKPDQERILAIRITRAGFEQALSEASLSHYDPDVDASHEEWQRRKQESPVRVQWDPERTLQMQPLPWRSLQIGLSGRSARHYVNDWITEITDVTGTVAQVRRVVDAGDLTTAAQQIPGERAYPLPEAIARTIGASRI